VSLRDLLLILHISGAGVWLGANVLQAVVPRMAAIHGTEAVAGWYRVAAKLGNRVYVPASLVILITGISLVLRDDAYGFGTRFVTVGFAMIVIGAVLGVVVFERTSKVAAEAIESGDDPRIRVAITKLGAFEALDTLLLLLTITAMVTRWS
jgi:uncharacterized membrane protein